MMFQESLKSVTGKFYFSFLLLLCSRRSQISATSQFLGNIFVSKQNYLEVRVKFRRVQPLELTHLNY